MQKAQPWHGVLLTWSQDVTVGAELYLNSLCPWRETKIQQKMYMREKTLTLKMSQCCQHKALCNALV